MEHNEWNDLATEAPTIQGTKNQVLNPIAVARVKKYAAGGSLFEYGCGWGEIADELFRAGYQVTAYDDADAMVTQAKGKFSGPHFLYNSEFQEALPQLRGTFDVVTSNLVLCILEKAAQDAMLTNIAALMKADGVAVISLCHPKYDYLPESLVSTRVSPPGVGYADEFMYEKEIKENGMKFHDYHRPMEYYTELFKEHGLEVLETTDSDVLGTDYPPDFMICVFKKKA